MTKKHFSRNKRNVLKYSTLLLVALLFFSPRYTYAYLEPGTLSYVLQVILAFFVGTLVAMKLFWAKIKKFMNNVFKRGETKNENSKKKT